MRAGVRGSAGGGGSASMKAGVRGRGTRDNFGVAGARRFFVLDIRRHGRSMQMFSPPFPYSKQDMYE